MPTVASAFCESRRVCLLRIKARGHRDLITIIGHAAIISAGEWVTASGDWVNDHTHGQQFSARPMRREVVWSCVDAPVDARDHLTVPAMIGCGHVSGLEIRLCHMPRAGMEIRRPGADQKSER
jgi:hypothetical protein